MPRLGLGLGLNLPKPVYLGGDSTPVVPSGFVGQYLAYYYSDFNLITGDNVETWSDRSTNNNDLTQTTSANQPILVENDVVKQSTLANQPTLVDTGGGVLAVQFGSQKRLGAYSAIGNKLIEIDLNLTSTGRTQFLLSASTSSASVRIGTNESINLRTDDNTSNIFPTGTLTLGRQTIKIWFNGTDASLYINDVFQSTLDLTGKTLDNLNLLGSSQTTNAFDGDIYSAKFYDAVANPLSIVETPVLVFLSETQYLRNSSDVEASAGDDISAWQSTTHNQFDNVVRADATNDLMAGLPAHDCLVFRKAVNTLGTQKVLFSSSTTSAQIRTNASDQIEVVSDAGTVFTYATSTVLTTQQTTILQLNGTNLELYESPTLLEAKDFTGETLTIDRALGSASDTDWKEIWPYPNALDETGRNYFYYLRNDQNEILLPPLLPS